MKITKILVAALATFGMVACCNNTPKQFIGFISDASMNTVVVKALTEDKTQIFSTEDADMTDANGMLIGAPIIVDYVGCLKEGTPAVKVATDATYSAAVGAWTMTDPINAESVMGMRLMVEGAAESINMASLLYTAWELQGEANKIILKGTSQGSGAPIEFTQVATLSQNAEGAWSLSIDDTDIVLTKSAL